jgi:hypothetical protein
MSMIRKGMKTMKPIWKAVLSSEVTKAGNHHPHRQVFGLVDPGRLGKLGEQVEVGLAHLLEHEGLDRYGGPVEGFVEGDAVFRQGLPGLGVDLVEHRRHDEEGEEQGQADITWLGGEVWVPMAWRNSDMTMMIRVKLVIISTRAGRKLREVSSSRVWMDRLYWVPPPPAGVLVSAGMAWARTGQGQQQEQQGAARSMRGEVFHRVRRSRVCLSQVWKSLPPEGEPAGARGGEVSRVEGVEGIHPPGGDPRTRILSATSTSTTRSRGPTAVGPGSFSRAPRARCRLRYGARMCRLA